MRLFVEYLLNKCSFITADPDVTAQRSFHIHTHTVLKHSSDVLAYVNPDFLQRFSTLPPGKMSEKSAGETLYECVSKFFIHGRYASQWVWVCVCVCVCWWELVLSIDL